MSMSLLRPIVRVPTCLWLRPLNGSSLGQAILHTHPIVVCGKDVTLRISLSHVLQQRRFYHRENHYGHRVIGNLLERKGIMNYYFLAIPVLLFVPFFDVEWCLRKTLGDPFMDGIDSHILAPWKKWLCRTTGVNATCIIPEVVGAIKSEEEKENAEIEVKDKDHTSFRDRKIIEYENRIRLFSTPDKIFRYFATIKTVNESDGESEVMMTPEDFMRAITPGMKQPDNLGLDQYRRIDVSSKDMKELTDTLNEEKKKMEQGMKKESIFYKLSSYGLITFSDFLFLMTVLSVSRRHFEIAFRMYDLNGDGEVEYEEFAKVQNAILSHTSVGQKLDRSCDKYRGVSSALAKYFFGHNLKAKLTINKFLDFQSTLTHEMLVREFEGRNPVNNVISEVDFGNLMIVYGGFPETKKARMLMRVKKEFGKGKGKKESPKAKGITLKDYEDFHVFLQNINDVDIALTFFKYGTAGIDKITLKHAAKTVANVDLNDHLIDVIFTLFDEDQDGFLSNREFISVMKERVRRGLAKPKDTGFTRLLQAIVNSCKIQGTFM